MKISLSGIFYAEHTPRILQTLISKGGEWLQPEEFFSRGFVQTRFEHAIWLYRAPWCGLKYMPENHSEEDYLRRWKESSRLVIRKKRMAAKHLLVINLDRAIGTENWQLLCGRETDDLFQKEAARLSEIEDEVLEKIFEAFAPDYVDLTAALDAISVNHSVELNSDEPGGSNSIHKVFSTIVAVRRAEAVERELKALSCDHEESKAEIAQLKTARAQLQRTVELMAEAYRDLEESNKVLNSSLTTSYRRGSAADQMEDVLNQLVKTHEVLETEFSKFSADSAARSSKLKHAESQILALTEDLTETRSRHRIEIKQWEESFEITRAELENVRSSVRATQNAELSRCEESLKIANTEMAALRSELKALKYESDKNMARLQQDVKSTNAEISTSQMAAAKLQAALATSEESNFRLNLELGFANSALHSLTASAIDANYTLLKSLINKSDFEKLAERAQAKLNQTSS